MVNKIKQTGIGLIELMISILIGLLLMAGAISALVATIGSNADNIRMIRLEQDLRSVMSLVTRELQLAGSWRGAVNNVLVDDPLLLLDNNYPSVPVVNGNCIIFAYGKDANDDVGDNEWFGFRLSGNQIEYHQNAGVPDCGAGTGPPWEPLTVTDAMTQIDIFDLEISDPITSPRVTDVTVSLTGRTWLTGDDRANAASWSAERTLDKTIRIRNN